MRKIEVVTCSPRDPDRVTKSAPSPGSNAGFVTGCRFRASLLPNVNCTSDGPGGTDSPSEVVTRTGPSATPSGTSTSARLELIVTKWASTCEKRRLNRLNDSWVIPPGLRRTRTSPPGMPAAGSTLRMWGLPVICEATS